MSIKDYPTEELLAEISTRVRSDSPLYDPQELRDMLIKSESECSELRAQVERLRGERDDWRFRYKAEVLSIKDRLNDACRELEQVKKERDTLRAELQTERDTSNQRLTEIYDRARKAEIERDELQSRIAEMDPNGDRWVLLAQWNKAAAERDALQARIDAGVRVWSDGCNSNIWLTYALRWCDSHTALIIDRQPIADHVPDAEKMVDDDQKGEADRNTLTQDQFDQLEDLDR